MWRNQHTNFRRHFQKTLPQHHPTHSHSQIVQGSPVVDHIKESRKTIENEYDVIYARVPGFRKHTQEEYFWGRMVTLTRSFRIAPLKTNVASTCGSPNDTSIIVLVPLADLLNHRRSPNTKWGFDRNNAEFLLTATDHIRQGEGVHDSYGNKVRCYVHRSRARECETIAYEFANPTNECPRANEQKNNVFFRNYGFTVARAPMDLKIDMVASDFLDICMLPPRHNMSPRMSSRQVCQSSQVSTHYCALNINGIHTPPAYLLMKTWHGPDSVILPMCSLTFRPGL
jgi:hypothetical protein